MKLRRIIAGMAAAAMAAAMAISASATNIYDVLEPGTEAFNKVGALPFFMSQQWEWCEGTWAAIQEDGTIHAEYEISPVLADKSMSGQGTLGDMGIMILNLPEENYPYDMKVTEATFTPKDGETITLQSVLDIPGGYHDAETGIRIHIRPGDAIDKDTGAVTAKACPEVAGWDEPGKFNGGTLKITVDFKNAPPVPVEAGGGSDGSEDPAAGSDKSADTGAAAGGAAALVLLAAAGTTVVVRRRK